MTDLEVSSSPLIKKAWKRWKFTELELKENMQPIPQTRHKLTSYGKQKEKDKKNVLV